VLNFLEIVTEIAKLSAYFSLSLLFIILVDYCYGAKFISGEK